MIRYKAVSVGTFQPVRSICFDLVKPTKYELCARTVSLVQAMRGHSKTTSTNIALGANVAADL
jgi:hypothetical protein